MAAVRYANSGGIIVRDNPAGNQTRAINAGDLMNDNSLYAPVTKALNGTTYTWIYVDYYATNPPVGKGTGWVAKETTTQASASTPSKSSVIAANRVLLQNEMLTNARYIYNYLRSLPSSTQWSKGAIVAMLGNMEKESTINPDRWQNGTVNPELGYGLVQWTPSTKYTNWLPSGADKKDIDNQLGRILYEVSNGVQWLSSKHSPAMSFAEFTKSTKSVDVLAEYFLRCYEQPNITASEIQVRKDNG
jgi:hypothetical protein